MGRFEHRVNYRSPRVYAARFGGCSLIGKHLQEARERKNLSIRSLAHRLGLSPSFVSQVERGLSMPSVACLYVMATELDVSVDELFSTIAEKEPIARATRSR
jgi:transcriptional regulator with XRE-family HTH domain